MINFIILLLIVPSALILLWQRTTPCRAKRRKGQRAPDTSAVDGGIGTPNRVYFFHASYCSPCHSMIPLVDGLRRGHPNLIKVDVAIYPKLARDFGITAIPSFITVTDGRIQGVRPGAQSESWLRAQLGPVT